MNVFLDILAFLAPAIVQAVAFINTDDTHTLSEYISDFKTGDRDAIALLSQQRNAI